MSEWNVAPAATDDSFKFVPPEGAMTITFMPLNTRSTAK
jgi:outer membrane lipoprotein-sorting protein